MSAENIIRESIEKAKTDGLAIVRGPVHVWEKDKVVAVDCFGSVMYAHNQLSYPGFQNINGRLWMYELLRILNKDSSWWSRFHFGFHHKRQLTLEISGKDGVEFTPCKISKSAWALSDQVGSIDLQDYLKQQRDLHIIQIG